MQRKSTLPFISTCDQKNYFTFLSPCPHFVSFPTQHPTSYSNSFFLAINTAPSQMAENLLKRHILKYSPSITSFHFSWWPLPSKKLCSIKWDLTPQVISSPRLKLNESKPLSSSFLLRDFYTAMETKPGDPEWLPSLSTLGPPRMWRAVRKQRSSCSVTETIRMRKYIRKPIKPSKELKLCAKWSTWELKYCKIEWKLNRSSDGSIRRESESSQIKKARFYVELVDTKGEPNVKTADTQNWGAVREGII